jgi:riboflavin biosynthesis pyrimidine reductase
MRAPVFTRLLPEGGKVEVQELIALLDLESLAHPERPYTLVNFVASADGRAAFDGRSGPLGDAGDKAMFHALREGVDAVLAGTGTLETERYGRILGRPERRERRRAAGRSAEPLACVISRSGRVPLDIPLFAEPEQDVVLFAPVAPDLAGVAATVHFHHLDARSDRPLTEAMRVLRTEHGVRSLLCEGGPTLFASLLEEALVDELFLTIAPLLAGGASGPAVTAGPPLGELARLRIRWLLEHEDSLLIRYALA